MWDLQFADHVVPESASCHIQFGFSTSQKGKRGSTCVKTCENYSMCSYALYYVCRARDYEIAWKWSCLATSLAQGILQACLFYHCRHVSFHQFQIVVLVQKATIGLNMVQARIIKSSALQKPLAENAQTHRGSPSRGPFLGTTQPLTSLAADYPGFQLRTS